jgi:hypothetical protein
MAKILTKYKGKYFIALYDVCGLQLYLLQICICNTRTSKAMRQIAREEFGKYN